MKKDYSFCMVFVIILLLTCSSSDSGNSPLDLLPRDNDIEGWMRDPASIQQAWDENSLYDVINGGAELYIQYGFEEGAFAYYINLSKEYQIETQLYRINSSESAKILYDNLETGAFSSLDGSTRLAFGLGNIQLEAVRGWHFLRIVATSVANEKRDEAQQVILAFDDVITGSLPK